MQNLQEDIREATGCLVWLTHHVHILTMNGDSYRLKQSAGRRRAATSTNAAEQNQAIAETDNQVYAPAVDPGIV